METREQINTILSALHMREEVISADGSSITVMSIQGSNRELLKAKLVNLLLQIDSDTDQPL